MISARSLIELQASWALHESRCKSAFSLRVGPVWIDEDLVGLIVLLDDSQLEDLWLLGRHCENSTDRAIIIVLGRKIHET